MVLQTKSICDKIMKNDVRNINKKTKVQAQHSLSEVHRQDETQMPLKDINETGFEKEYICELNSIVLLPTVHLVSVANFKWPFTDEVFLEKAGGIN